jgi:hypothetical protein
LFRTSKSGLGKWSWLVGSALLLASALGAGGPAPAAAAGNRPVLAMYYAWFDNNTWSSGQLSDQPAAPYVSSDRSTIERQVGQAQQAGIDAFELDWWGPNNPTDTNLQTLLSVANEHNFKVTICFDLNSPFQHNAGDVTNFLTYARRYETDPAWLQFKGRPVVVFYGVQKYDVGTWPAIRAQADPGNHALWIGEGDDFSYLSVFDGIYPYSIAWSPDPAGQLASYASRTRAVTGKLWMATTMPGYDDTHLGRSNGFAVSRQNGAYYTSVWQGAIATNPDLISIATFNEWPEGSTIEPSVSYGNLYLQLTKQTRLGWLTDPAITAAFEAAGSTDRAIKLYGLPMSAPERHGPFIVQRFQRIAFQRWVDRVPGMPVPGRVVRVLAGDYLKQLGIVPAAAAILPT